MKRFSFVLMLLCVSLAGTANAQTSAPAPTSTPYAEVLGGVTWGNDAGGLFGGEVGMPYRGLDFFFELGHMMNVPTDNLDEAAAVITSVLASSGTASSTAKQPITYFAFGLRHPLRKLGPIHPAVSVAIGGAHVDKDVAFFVNGADVTDQLLERYGIQLGRDLAGSQTRFMFEIGASAQMPITGRVFADVSYRYARVFLIEPGMNTNRIHVGVGVGF